MLIKGENLTEAQRKQVLAAFGYRWTKENERRADGWHYYAEQHPTIKLISDEEWLSLHAFHFLKDGSRLCYNRQHAEPNYLAD